MAQKMASPSQPPPVTLSIIELYASHQLKCVSYGHYCIHVKRIL